MDQQIGLEPSPEAYITKMVEVFAGVRRVLRKDGTLWLNIGDSYAGPWGAQGRQGATGEMANRSVIHARQIEAHPKRQSKTGSVAHLEGIKAKDLIGIPWMLAFALRADGWYLRSDIVWAKPNPMPESVTDRPTKSHEYLFLLSKSKKYYYDTEAAKEPAQSNHPSGNGFKREARLTYRDGGGGARGNDAQWNDIGGKRNRRTVWNVPTQPFKAAHFATFPPKLIEPCVLAGTSEHGCCVSCGAPYQRETKKVDSGRTQKMADGWDTSPGGHGSFHREGREPGRADVPILVTVTVGWKPTCACVPNTAVPCTVLDPFVGAGTTLLVASQHGRQSVGIELNAEYAEIARQRLLAPPKPKKTSRKKAPSAVPPPSLQPLPLFIQ